MEKSCARGHTDTGIADHFDFVSCLGYGCHLHDLGSLCGGQYVRFDELCVSKMALRRATSVST